LSLHDALPIFMGGNPRSMNFRRMGNDEEVLPEGPVVASAGVKMREDEKRVAPMLEYPEEVRYPEGRYTTDYGLEWTDLMSPPWSYIEAYDLNYRSIKWKTPSDTD